MRHRLAMLFVWSLLIPRPGLAATSANDQGSVKWFCTQIEVTSDKTTKGAKTDQGKHGVQQCIEVINAGVAQKRFRYYAEIAKSCVHDQATCPNVLSGQVLAGGSCESSLDCQQPLVCIGPKGGPPGHCAKPLASGQTCDDEIGAGRFFALALAKRSVCAIGTHCAQHPGAADSCVKD